jgi:colicin import membrane protein
MKSIIISALVLCCATAQAQQTVDPGQSPVQVERARIASERAAVDARYLAEEKACYKKFSVNDCLNDARGRQRESLADLRRQDLSLNDAERKRRAADEMRRLEEKASPQKQDEAAERRARSLSDQRVRDDKVAKKEDTAAENEANAKSRIKAQLDKQKDVADKAAARASKAALAPQEAAKRDQKVKDAQEHRERVEKNRKERTKPLGNPLPPIPAPLK